MISTGTHLFSADQRQTAKRSSTHQQRNICTYREKESLEERKLTETVNGCSVYTGQQRNREKSNRKEGRKMKGQCPHLGPVLLVQFREIYNRCELQFKDGNEDDIQI